MIRNQVFNKGEIIVATEGEFSDYNVVGIIKVLKTFQPIDYIKKESKWSPTIARLEALGLIKELENRHLDTTEIIKTRG